MASPVTHTLPSLRIRFADDKVRAAEADLAGIRNGLPRAISGAINKLLKKTRTRTTQELANIVTVAPNNIRRRITKVDSTVKTLRGAVHIQLRQIALINFKFKEKRRKKKWGTAASGTGVEVQIFKNGPAQRFPHAFVAKGRRDQKGGGGNRHIFERVRSAAGKRVARFPIVSLKGVSMMKVFESRPDAQRRVRDYIDAETPKELDSQVNYLLKRRKVPTNA